MSDTPASPAAAATAAAPSASVDVLIVGAGFGGMYSLHKMRELGLSARAVEAGGDVGGTWYWNRYPGARCDVESVHYSYQFDDDLQQEWTWSERYAAQPEILSYARHVADRYDLRRDILFNTRVASAHFRDGTDSADQGGGGHWRVETDAGDVLTARYLIMATSGLSVPNIPQLEGQDSFAGEIYHTGQWPHEPVDFTGKRVAVIGTGSSGIQSIPRIAEQAEHVTVFQRTPNYVVPAWNRLLPPEEIESIKANYAWWRRKAWSNFAAQPFDPYGPSVFAVPPEQRERIFEASWGRGGLPFSSTFSDLLYDEEANKLAGDFVRRKIREVVHDPEVADLLCPKNVFGCKRLCVATDYFETFNRPNVSLVDISEEPIERIAPEGVRRGDELWEVDAIVFATGFDAMTGALLRMDIRGRGGLALKDKWAEGPVSYLGLMVEGFPNMFTITGPGSPSVLTNMVTAIEQHVQFIGDCLAWMEAHGRHEIEPTKAAEDAWVAHNRDVAGKSLRSTCASWYVGANIPGKPQVFMPYIGGFPAYDQRCKEIAAADYEGFAVA